MIPRIIVRYSLHVFEIIIDLTEAPGRSRRHGAEKSGSGVLLRVHFIGVDYELSALFEKHRISVNHPPTVRKVHVSLES